MFSDSAHYYQLVIAIIFGIVLFVGAYSASEKAVLSSLILIIPFQFIDSRYGSLNMVLTYTIGFVFLLRGRVTSLPLIGPVLLIMFSYLLSLSQIEPGTLVDHLSFIVSIGSNFLLFYMAYNYFTRAGDDGVRQLWKLLIILNVFVLVYCALQFIAGLTGRVSFGLEELTLNAVREDRRLTGPFLATAITAEYLCIQNIIIMYSILHQVGNRNKKMLWILFTLNCGVLIATGNRGGIVTLVIGLFAFVYIFRKELGGQAIARFMLASILLFAVISVVIVKFTDFNVLFDRLENTEFKGYVPDTRQGWKYLWPLVIEKPVIGHGPRLKMSVETYAEHRRLSQMQYPHNAAMFLIYTVGTVGLVAYLIFFTSLFLRFMRARNNPVRSSFQGGIPRVAIVVLIVIAASEIRMEMFRFSLNDYQQYVMMLMAGLLAALTRIPSSINITLNKTASEVPGVPARILSSRKNNNEPA